MKTILRTIAISCALISSASAINTRVTLGWPQGLGSAGNWMKDNALPMHHLSKHSLDMTGTGVWWSKGDEYVRILGLGLDYSYDFGKGFFAGVSGGLMGGAHKLISTSTTGNKTTTRTQSGTDLDLQFSGGYVGYHTDIDKLSLTGLVLAELVGKGTDTNPSTLGLGFAGDAGYELLKNDVGTLALNAAWYYQFAVPSRKNVGRYHTWQWNRGHMVDLTVGPTWRADNWFAGLAYRLSAGNLLAGSAVSIDEARHEAEMKKESPVKETFNVVRDTAASINHSAVAHVGMGNDNYSLTLWASQPLEKAKPTVGITASMSF